MGLVCLPLFGETWYVRHDGGTRYSANARKGQCDGKADAAYRGSGTNQHCAFKDYGYLWDDQSYNNDAWEIAGGDNGVLQKNLSPGVDIGGEEGGVPPHWPVAQINCGFCR